jgi:hypothetical protein
MDVTNVVKLDLEDIDLLRDFNWRTQPEGYFVTQVNMSHLVVQRAIGRRPTIGEVVDHINGIVTDNRRENLRIVSKKLNAANKNIYSKNSATGYRGVCFSKKTKRYEASIQLRKDRKRVYKSFLTLEEAAEWVIKKREEVLGEYAHYCIPISRDT